MKLLALEAKSRDTKMSAKNLRKLNLIPTVCYGKESKPVSAQIDYQTFRRLFKQVSTTQVFNLVLEGKETPVLVHEIDYNPVTDKIDHIDFLQVNMNVKLTASVPVETTGVAPALKNFNCAVTVTKHEIEVKCLPMDIPHNVVVDLSKLENVGDAIFVKDLNLGDKVEILDDGEEVLVTVTAVEEFKENVAEVPDELKAEPVAAEGAEAGKETAEPKAEEKSE